MKIITKFLTVVSALTVGNICLAADNQPKIPLAGSDVSKSANLGRYAGVWLVQYQNGAHRQYAIDSSGEVSWLDFEPAKKCRIIVQGNDHLIDFEDGKLERISRKGSVIQIDHFDPAAKYRNKLPGIQATGTKIKK